MNIQHKANASGYPVETTDKMAWSVTGVQRNEVCSGHQISDVHHINDITLSTETSHQDRKLQADISEHQVYQDLSKKINKLNFQLTK